MTLDLNSGEITGTIDNSASQGGPNSDGTYTVEVTATDDNGETVSTTFTWTVANPGPSATDNTGSVTEETNTLAAGNVITDDNGFGVDSDPDADDLTISEFNGTAENVGVIVNGTYGRIFINDDGNYTYNLDDSNPAVDALDVGETLTDSFTYTVTDSEGGTATANLTITINGTNDAPVVGGTIPSQVDDDADLIAPVDVTSAFSDVEGDTLTYTANGLPDGLTIDLNTGEITGTIDNSASQGGPNSDGVYTVEVTATDDNGAAVSTTFTWTVGNPGPNATDNTNSITEDAAATTGGNVLSDDDGFGSDSDPDADDLAVSQVNGVDANVGVAVNGNYGDIVVNGDGTYTYTIDNTNADVDALDNGETLTEIFTYTLTDNEGGTASATISITIDGANDAPIAGGTLTNQTDADADSISGVVVTGAFSDVDGDTLTYTATGLPAGLTLDLNTGEITGTIDNSASQAGPNSDGVYIVEVTATDDNGEVASTTFTWTVTNPGPTALDNSGEVTEDVTASTSGNVILDDDGSGVDSDPDGDNLIVSSLDGSAANVGVSVAGDYGTIVLNNDGTYTYTVDNSNADVNALDNGETLNERFFYRIIDGEGGTDFARLNITINGTNDAPIVGGTIPAQANDDADSITAVDVTGAFSDPDGDTLTYAVTGLPAGLSIDPTTGQITGTIDNSASQAGPDGNGVYTVEVTATDDNGASVTTSFDWTVANPGPTAFDNTASVTEDTALTDSGNVITDDDGLGVDSDPDGDSLFVSSFEGSAANVGVSVDGDYGSIVLQSDGLYTYTLDNNNADVNELDNGETLTDTFFYRIVDGEGGTDFARLVVTINGTNDAPITSRTIPAQSSDDAETITSVDVTGAFSDPDGDTLTYAATGLPSGLAIDLSLIHISEPTRPY